MFPTFTRFIKASFNYLFCSHIDPFPPRHYLGRYSRSAARADLSAGVNVALLAFPQGMAYALIAGLPIEYGILSFISASLIAALFASSRFNSYGPSNASAVLILSTFLALQLPDELKTAALPLLVFFTGVILIIGAYLKVARLVQYVSKTVITGYITGAALLIIANQIKNVLGFSIPSASNFYGVLKGTLLNITETHWPSLVLALATAAVYFGLTRRFRALPNVAISLVIASVLAWLMGRFGYQVGTLSAVSLRDWSMPSLDFGLDGINQIFMAAIALAFLITLESCSIGKSLAARAGDRLNPNQEIFGLGLGNVVSAFAGGMAASASLTRSSLNCTSKSFSPLSNVYAALFVLSLFVLLGGLIGYIPTPSLAVLVISIGLTLINRHTIRIVTRATRSDAVVFFSTLAIGLIFALDTAIYVGTILSIALFLGKVATPEMVEYDFNNDGQLAQIGDEIKRSNPEVSIVHVEGELFFGAADVFHDQMRRVCEDPNLKIVVLKMRNAHHLDATSVLAFEELAKYMKEKNRYLLLSETRKDVLRVLKRSGVFDVLNRENVFPDNPSNPTYSTARALRRAKAILGGENATVSIYVDPQKDKRKRAERKAEVDAEEADGQSKD